MSPCVNVIVTCYNHEKYIEQCLRSIFSQTYSNLTVLVIDDGSTDNSVNVIERVLKDTTVADTEFRQQENNGVSLSRNWGINWSLAHSGEFVLFVDSDNYLDNHYIEMLMKTALSKDADIIYGNLIDTKTGETVVEPREYSFSDHLSQNFIDNCSLIRKSKIGDTRYDVALNRKHLEDYDFILSLVINHGARPVYASKANLNYRVLVNSVSKHGDMSYYYDTYLYIMRKYVDSHRNLVFEAIKTNLMGYDKRLTDLIEHLASVTDYVNQLQSDMRQVKDEKKQLIDEAKQLIDEKDQLIQHTNNLATIRLDLEQQIATLLASKSYRLGHIILRPIKLVITAMRHPKLVLRRMKRVVPLLLPAIKRPLYRILRGVQRQYQTSGNKNRILVYVIYESERRLQPYKLLFLEALAKLSDQVLIVVNGDIDARDTSDLQQYGEVVTRENSGYDTAAFKFGITYLGQGKLSQFDELLLVNDTNVGPMSDLSEMFDKMATKGLDFWGISYGEPQPDFTGYNPYQTIPSHLQSYFLVINRLLLKQKKFSDYWEKLSDTDSRDKAIGKHETVFTKYFEDLGFRHGAVTNHYLDSPMYIHPLTMIRDQGVPLVKYTAFANDTDDKFAWQGLSRHTEVPELLTYIESETDYPMVVIDEIMTTIKNKQVNSHILIIDGVENVIPQCTRYRVLNKAEQLEKAGFKVWVINQSSFEFGYAEYASQIIIYRCAYSEKLAELILLAKRHQKPVYYDIDDLVIDTIYTDQLAYTQSLNDKEKASYDQGVRGYGKLLSMCDGAITSTQTLKSELMNYQPTVFLNRNLASAELVDISSKVMKDYASPSSRVKIGYFSGSITHNENFELIKLDIIKILEQYSHVELHLVGNLDIPKELRPFKQQLVFHDYVDWHILPSLIAEVDINIAPLVDSLFNRAKSEIKWIEAGLVKVPTIASNIGAFKEMIVDGETGVLANNTEWFEKLENLILSQTYRKEIGENACDFILENCVTSNHRDELIDWILGQ